MSDPFRSAVITGAGTGIGAACALALADGFDRLVLLGRRVEKLDEVRGQLALSHPNVIIDTRSLDVTDVEGIEALFTWASGELGTVDALVNNAGSPQPKITGGLADVAAAWESTWRANALSVVLMTEALKPLLRRPGGRVITIGSFAAALGTGSPAYASAKAAIETYSMTLMRELGPEGITCNVVAPGYTQGTELLTGRISPDRHERLVSSIAVRRAGTPDEIAGAVAYLASPLAGFVNGQVLTANGGTYLPG